MCNDYKTHIRINGFNFEISFRFEFIYLLLFGSVQHQFRVGELL